MIKLKSINFLVESAVSTFKRFPLVLLMAFASTGLGIYYIQVINQGIGTTKPLLTVLLGLPLFIATTTFIESRDGLKNLHKVLIQFGAGLFLLGYYFGTGDNYPNNFYLQYVHLSFAMHLLVAFSGYLFRNDENGFWQFNKSLYLRLSSSAIYSGVFFLGLSLALFASSKLFNFHVEGILYAQFWCFAAFTVLTWHFLTGIPKPQNAGANSEPYPTSLKYLIQYILIPLVTLYSAILYVYMLQILFTNNWPEGYVGWLVSVMSVLGVFNLLLIYPEQSKAENKWLVHYSKYYYVMILPLLVMLFIAAGKRIAEYGVTEKRYLLVVLGLWLFIVALYFVLSRQKKIKVIPVSLFLVAVITLWGPLSAYRVSLHSQKGRAVAILQKNNLLVDGKARPGEKLTIAQDELTDLVSALDYIVINHGRAVLSDLFPENVLTGIPKEEYRQSSERLVRYVGLDYTAAKSEYSSGGRYVTVSTTAFTKPVDIGGFASLIRFSTYSDSDIKITDKKLKFKYNRNINALEFLSGDEVVEAVDIMGFAKKYMINAPDSYVNPETVMSVDLKKAKVRVVIDSMTGNVNKGENSVTINSVEGFVLY